MIFGDSTEQTGSGVFLPSINLSNDLLLLADFKETLSNEVTVCDLAKLTCLILKIYIVRNYYKVLKCEFIYIYSHYICKA